MERFQSIVPTHAVVARRTNAPRRTKRSFGKLETQIVLMYTRAVDSLQEGIKKAIAEKRV